ncbi:MAG: hypothetical protein Q9172_004650 [Xanthocarpia lactea]
MSADKDSPAQSSPNSATRATVERGDEDVVYPGHLKFGIIFFALCLSVFQALPTVTDEYNSLADVGCGRAIAGVGALGILSGVLTILSNSVPRSKLAPVNGVLGAFTGLAFICGPLIGGGIISATTWRWIFWMNPILSVPTYAVVVFWIHLKSPKRSSWKKKLALLDLPAFTISLALIICLLLALQWGGTEYPWRNARIVVLFILFGILTGIFAAMEVRKKDNALVPLKIVTQRSIAYGIFFSFCTSGAGFILEYYLPLWLQAVKDLSVISSAVHLLPSIIAALVCTIGSGILAPIIGYCVPFMLGATVFLAVGMGLLMTLRWDSRMALILGYQVPAGAGLGLALQQTVLAAQTMLPMDDIPIGVSLIVLAQTLGGTISLSAADTIFTTSLSLGIANAVPQLEQSTALNSGATTLRNLIPPEYLDTTRVLGKVIEEVAKRCDVSPDQIEDLYPCTPIQHGLLALSTASTAAYVAQHVFRLQPEIKIDRMKDAWEVVMKRNAILRTQIVNLDTRTLQVVLKGESLSWGDCTDLDTYLAVQGQHAMQYGRPLSCIAVSKTHIVWTVHHSLYDGRSVQLMLEDIAAAYQGEKLPTRTTFRNFIKYIQHGSDETQRRSFWTARLSAKDVLPFPPTPRQGHRPHPNTTMEHHAQSLFTASSQVTTGTLFQAAWALVLSSHLSTQTVSFGLTVSGRNAAIAGIESMMGPTLATVPMCLELDMAQSVGNYLESVQQYSTQMITYQHVGLQNIRKYSREAAQACEFLNLLEIHPAEQDSPEPPYSHMLKREEAEIRKGFFNYALTVQCSLASSGVMRALAVFDEHLIHPSQMQRLLFQLEHVVRQLGSSDTSKPLREVSLVSPQDLARIEGWNGKPAKTAGLPFDEIHRHIEIRPESAAVYYLSLRLANHLAFKNGVGPGIIVPICFDRSLWMIVVVIAVMRTGAAFTLLDPAYPVQRLERIIAITSSEMVLVSRLCHDLFPTVASKRLTIDERFFCRRGSTASSIHQSRGKLLGCHVGGKGYLHTHRENLRDKHIDDPLRNMPSLQQYPQRNTANGISITEPKGVIVSHGSYYTGTMAHNPYYELGPGSRYLLFGSPAFDLYIHEIVSTLMTGGCICVPSGDDQMGDITGVIRFMDILVGEALAKDQQEAWADRVCLLNSYGPSECSVITNIHKGVTKSSDTANIGPIIAGSGWIVDRNDHDRRLPLGAAGELLIEGPLLGRGYLNDPEKTAAAFIENPRWASRSAGRTRRFYKTGDVVRYGADGSLVLEGRKDTQVKIRGQRVEISEVEYQLGKLFPNASGVAVVYSRREETSELIAMVSCGGIWDTTAERHGLLPQLADASISTLSDIKARLGKTLPRHMVPARCVLVPGLPILPSGKLDRKKLQQILDPDVPHHELHEFSVTTPYIEPDNRIAMQLSDRLVNLSAAKDSDRAEALSRRDLSLSSLDLDSIQLINLLSFIRKEFDVSLSIALLYEDNLTISVLAKIISDHRSGLAAHNGNELIELSNEVQNAYRRLLISTEPPSYTAAPQLPTTKKTVFLTGATGYLGHEILRQLVTSTSIQKVIVHVRAPTVGKALERVIHAATLSKWWSSSYISRIECWPGDLGASNLGLPAPQWKILTGDCGPDERIGGIIHNGVAVQWQAPYAALKAVNVGSTITLLSATRRSPFPISFTYVSGGEKISSDGERGSLAADIAKANGYSQTKHVSEELVAKYARQGDGKKGHHAFHIVRPGLIVGTEEDGVPNADDFLWRLVQACYTVGGYPKPETGAWLAVADVREVAAASVLGTSTFISSGSEEQLKLDVTDIEAGFLVEDFWAIVTEELGVGIKAVNGEEWVGRMKDTLKQLEEEHPYRPLMAMLPEGSFNLGSQRVMAKRKKVDGIEEETAEGATSCERVCRAIRKNLRVLESVGFFAAISEHGRLDAIPRVSERVATFNRSGLGKGVGI